MTPEQHSRDDTEPDLGRDPSPRPAPVDSDDHRQLLKDVIKAQLFPSEAVPVTIGRFRVLSPLGAGGMSVVYGAYDEQLDRRVAVKLLKGSGSPDSQARLLREAQAMARLAHPNVVAVHEAGLWGAQVYIAMEFVKGVDLRAWLALAPRAWPEVVEVFTAAGHGLAAAHQAGLVHRDFKPANVLLGDDGRARVVDFGLVRQSDEPSAAVPSDRPIVGAAALHATLTATGAILGTPAYMSPEQHQGRPADARSDQFSFCVALYEGLHGALPFAGDSLPALADAVLAGRVRPVPEDSRVPAWLRRVVLRGLAVDPAARWPSMDELLDELGRDPDRLRRARLRLAVIVGLVAALVLSFAWLARSQADVARVAQRAEAAAERQRRLAEDNQEAAEAQRDQANQDLRKQLAATETALADLGRALKAASAERQRAEDESTAADAARARAESQRKAADAARRESELQTTRAVKEARRARDATRLAQSLGAAEGDPTTVLALLRETEDPAATPGWIPAAVATLLQPVSRAVLRLHRGSVHAAAFSPDGRHVVSAGDDHLAARWRWDSGEAPLLREHAAPVKFLAFGTGDTWASGDADGEVLVGAAGTPRRIAHGGELRAMALSGDGQRLVTAGADGRVRLWSLADDRPPRELRGHTGAVLSAMFDRSGDRLVTAGADASARVWSLTGDAPPRVLQHPGAVRLAVLRPDGRRVATGGQDGEVREWPLTDGAPPLAPPLAAPIVHRGHTGEVVALAYRPDGGALLSASLDGSARVWSLQPGQKDRLLRGHTGKIYSAQWSPDGDRVVTASQDGSARVWPADGRPPIVLRGHAEELSAAAFSQGGDHVVTAGRDGSVRVWQVRGTAEAVPALRPGGRVTLLAWSPDSARLLSARSDGAVALWRPDTARSSPLAEPGPTPLWLAATATELHAIRDDGILLRWPADGGTVTRQTLAPATPALLAAGLDPSTTRVALATADALWLLSPGTGERRPLRGHEGTLLALAWSPDGRTLLTGASDRSARLWPTDLSEGTGESRILGPHSGGVTAVAFRPDGAAVATASWDKRARVWPLVGGDPQILVGHTGPVWAVAFSPDGARVATGADDRSVRVWPRAGDDPAVLTGHSAPVRAVAFRPDGAVLASAGDDGTIRLWNADFSPEGLQARLRAASPVCLSARQRVQLLAEDRSSAEATAAACTAAAQP
ncbi:protein kinase [Nannocystis sp.]|uniref:WD40 repeat domain-containing serine/threonine protein kinase n=1 Tax=Nannocystis sp. TaxID=1962667 RepID=UPI0025D63B4B|nr:protein kinase [Nannocystis sp.]MBK7830434.1 protein kinase [Nannocystis sp.]